MAEDDEELSRRELLKRTGAALSALALAGACSEDPEEYPGGEGICGGPDQPGPAGTGTGAGAGAGTGPSAGGTPSPTGGRGGASAAGASGTTAPPGQDAGGTPQGGASGNPSPDAGNMPADGVSVAIVRNNSDLDAAVARAVQLAGGLDAIQPGQSVFIKVNAVSDRAIGTPGIRTSNEVMAAVVRLVKQRNPGRIIVGDRSARQFDTAAVFQNAGIADAAMAAGADEVYMAPSPSADADAWMLAQPMGYEGTWQSAGGILVMRRIVESDHLINVPACKNHSFALFSLSMKNFMGAIGDSSRGIHFGNFQEIGRDIAVLAGAFSPMMNVIDATTALLNGGPGGDGGNAVRASPGLILASRDRVALDALAVSLIKFELGRNDVPQPDASHDSLVDTRPWMFPQIVQGAELGLGVGSAAEVTLAFEDVADAAEIEAIFRS
jgi:uncharacterized protein (DUF362 family)